MCKSTLAKTHLLLTFCVYLLPQVIGHGRLIEPPSRASAWRYGFHTPPNYNDHELYCGGYSRQWQRNDGQCGLCGDAWDMPTPRPHELGGTYGQGVLVRRYNPASTITIRVELTANHAGKFVFGICPKAKGATQQCVNKHLLILAKPQQSDKQLLEKQHTEKLVQPEKYYYYPRDGNKIYEMRYRLPAGFECSHCVLQWRYTAGNNWGQCPNGTGAVGCGPQEEFRACADIAIGHGTADEQPDTTTTIPPGVSTPVDTSSEETPRDVDAQQHRHVVTLVLVFVALFVVVVLLGALYGYYYQVGKRVKLWLMKGGKVQQEKKQVVSPVPPPRRNRSRSLSAGFVDNESLA